MDENKSNINDALSEYYNLKNKYEKDYYNKYINPIIVGNYSKLAKRQQFQQLEKASCINCKQPVGTIFERKYYKEYNNKNDLIIFTAKCGNIYNPCDLDIEIHKSLRESYDSLIKHNSKELNKYQMEIIKLKNKILFLGKNKDNEAKYIDDFNTYKEAILYYSDVIGGYTEENIMMNNNPEENEKIINLISTLNQLEIMTFKDYIKEYMDNNDDNMLEKAINMYVNEIVPKLKEIRELKYKTMYIDHDEDKNKILIQSKYSLEGMNFYNEDVDEVVKFIKGSKVEDSKKRLKISELESKTKTKSKSKTLKNISDKKIKNVGKTLKNVDKTLKSETKKLRIPSNKIEKQEIELGEENKLEEENNSEEIDFGEVEFEIENNSEEIDFGEVEFEIENNKDKEQSRSESEEKIEFTIEPEKSDNIESLKIISAPKKIGKKIKLNEATEALEK